MGQGMTDLQYKDELRMDRDKLNEYIEMLDSGEYDKLRKKIETELNRINESLQD